MPEVLKAPITEEEYRTYPVYQLPPDYTGDKYIRFMNDCWAMLETRAKQPLSAAPQEHNYYLPGRYVNISPVGVLSIAPMYLPIVHVSSIKFKRQQSSDWVDIKRFDVAEGMIYAYDAPVERGSIGIVRLNYISGYDPIPDDLRLLLALFASQRASAGSFSVTAGGDILATWIPDDIAESIKPYKRVR